MLGAAYAFTTRLLRFAGSPDHPQRLRLQHGALKVLLPHFSRLAEELRRSFDIAAGEAGSGEVVVGVEEIGIEPDRLFELARGLVVVPRQRQHEPPGGVRLGLSRREFERPPADAIGLDEVLFLCAEPLVERGVHGREAGPGRAVAGVELDRVLEHCGASGQIGLRHAGQVLPSAKVVLVGRCAGRRGGRSRHFARPLRFPRSEAATLSAISSSMANTSSSIRSKRCDQR